MWTLNTERGGGGGPRSKGLVWTGADGKNFQTWLLRSGEWELLGGNCGELGSLPRGHRDTVGPPQMERTVPNAQIVSLEFRKPEDRWRGTALRETISSAGGMAT